MKVNLHVLFAQRKCSYAGEYAPEALEIMDQFGIDENGEWLQEQLESYKKKDKMLERLEIVQIEVDYDKIIAILNPEHVVPGKVITGESK